MQLDNIKTVSVPSIGKLPLASNPGTFTPSGVKRDHKPGRLAADGGYTETSTGARLELNLNLFGIDIAALGDIKDEDVTVRLASGAVHMMAQAFAAEAVPIGDGEGKLTLVANVSERIS